MWSYFTSQEYVRPNNGEIMYKRAQVQKPVLLNEADFSIRGYTHKTEWSCSVREADLSEEENSPNYYEATISKWLPLPPLVEDIICDVVVVGGGLLGTSAALHLARENVDTVILEQFRIGSGASGRNGGQLTPGLARWEAETMLAQFPAEEAARLWRFTSVEAMELIDRLAEDYDLDIRRKKGHLTAAVHPGHMNALAKEIEAREAMGDFSARLIGQEEVQDHVHSPLYFGAQLDEMGGQLHPLALTRGLAYAFSHHGGKIYENSKAVELTETPQGIRISTPQGSVLARKAVVLGVHHATADLLNQNLSTTLPLYSYVGVTNTDQNAVQDLMPTQMAVYDTQFQIDYYRTVGNSRFLFGGEGTGTQLSPDHMLHYLTQRLHTVFPDHKHLSFDYIWSGKTDVTYNGAADCKKYEQGKATLYAVHGWSGHGVAQTVRIGKAVCDDVLNKNDDFYMLSSIRHLPIPFAGRLSSIVIPLVKSWAKVSNVLAPEKMISF